MTHRRNPHRTSPHHHDRTAHRRIREAMGPGYQVAIFHEAAPFAPARTTRH